MISYKKNMWKLLKNTVILQYLRVWIYIIIFCHSQKQEEWRVNMMSHFLWVTFNESWWWMFLFLRKNNCAFLFCFIFDRPLSADLLRTTLRVFKVTKFSPQNFSPTNFREKSSKKSYPKVLRKFFQAVYQEVYQKKSSIKRSLEILPWKLPQEI